MIGRAGRITVKNGVDLHGVPYLSFTTDESFYMHLVVRGDDIGRLVALLSGQQANVAGHG